MIKMNQHPLTIQLKNLNHTLHSYQQEMFWAYVTAGNIDAALPFLFTAYVTYTREEIQTVFENYLNITPNRAAKGTAMFLPYFERRSETEFVYNPNRGIKQ